MQSEKRIVLLTNYLPASLLLSCYRLMSLCVSCIDIIMPPFVHGHKSLSNHCFVEIFSRETTKRGRGERVTKRGEGECNEDNIGKKVDYWSVREGDDLKQEIRIVTCVSQKSLSPLLHRSWTHLEARSRNFLLSLACGIC